jgi:hypothetical protein
LGLCEGMQAESVKLNNKKTRNFFITILSKKIKKPFINTIEGLKIKSILIFFIFSFECE